MLAQSQAGLCQSLDTLLPTSCEICTPLQNWGAAGSAGGPLPPSPWPAPLARGLGNKGLKKSDNFSPQLDLIFFFDAPTAGGRIAGEEQVRQEKCDFGGREARRAFREWARTLSQTPRIGVYSAWTAKLMTTRDPSRCSSEPSCPWGPQG